MNVTRAEFDFDAEEFKEISETAKDFVEKLLVQQPKYVSVCCCSLSFHAFYYVTFLIGRIMGISSLSVCRLRISNAKTKR